MSSRGACEPLAVGRVIGEVVDSFNPSVKMKVIYNGSKQVSNGHELMPAIIAAQPRVEIGGEDMRCAYTLLSGTPYISESFPRAIWDSPLTLRPSLQFKFAARVEVFESDTPQGTRPTYNPSWGNNKPVLAKYDFKQ
ncbi:CEN-like protein 1 [Capsicum annuum]|nr:CEN-like protein 1 [Capsicum annuum]